MSTEWDVHCNTDEDRALRVQLSVVSYLYHTVRLYPCVWIQRNLKHKFIALYIVKRRPYRTLQVLVTALVCTMVLPCVLANLFMHVDCQVHNFEVSVPSVSLETTAIVQLQDNVCNSVRELKDPVMMAVHGSVLLLVVFMVWVIFSRVLPTHMSDWIGSTVGNQFFPNIMQNGFGPKGTPHSLQEKLLQMKKHQAIPSHVTLSFWHDFFAPYDLIVVSCVLCVIMPVFICTTGAMVGGLKGFLAGCSIGLATAKFAPQFFNWWFGPPEQLSAAIRGELAEYQPLRRFLHDDQTPHHERLEEKVEKVARKFYEHAYAASLDRQKAAQRADDIRNCGKEVLIKLILWILKEPGYDGRQVMKLLEAESSSLSITERGLATLSFLDVDLFLMTYFDPEEQFLPHFLLNDKKPQLGTWKNQNGGSQLREVYISWPQFKICAWDRKEKLWRVESFLSNASAYSKDSQLREVTF